MALKGNNISHYGCICQKKNKNNLTKANNYKNIFSQTLWEFNINKQHKID